jgi:hypothetical protein
MLSTIRWALEEWIIEDDYRLSIDQLAEDLFELEAVSEIIEDLQRRKLNAARQLDHSGEYRRWQRPRN